ncbi:fructose-bisphosphate aldolase [Petrotoga sp. 9PW.55.5.1]|uniref:class I fructose-bisphosphate aldolase n=1 Tax=Petrotoga sp. 9PW.55.5.1 TaxID=1308979 RepID=UPI000DC41228|nr:fructose-bisphosphate aldolase [Petrotoga sp. 9PW.55.5.1]RAO98642.1 fructose-bisphosphate aldolase [Petrotoga sp. 9PW.55.5.1]
MGIKDLRISHILNSKSGKSVIIPIDHGLVMGNIEGLQDPIDILEKLIKLGIDGTLMSPGITKITNEYFCSKDAPGRILTIDLPLSSTIPGESGRIIGHEVISDIEFAIRNALDLVKVLLPWGEKENVQMESIKVVSKVATECDKWNIPLMVEPVFWGSHTSKDKKNDPKLIEHAARMALELGADILKIPYTGNVSEFKQLIKHLKVPVFVLGGPKMDNIKDILNAAKESIEAGAKGIVFGRNVWQNPKMESLIKGLKEIVHENASVDEAIKKYDLF